MTIVGVVPDMRQNDPTQAEIDPLIYVPLRQDPVNWTAIFARTSVDPNSLAQSLRKQVQSIDEDLPVFDVATLGEVFKRQRWAFNVFGTLFVIFAGIALALSAIGIYGIMAYAVSQRTPEIGLRMALGAGAGNIARLAVRQGVVQIAIGMVLGLAGAFALTRVIRRVLVQISPTDPVTFISVCVVLGLAAAIACWIPTRRAMKVDPIVALRYE
jgi:ABC-type antimicrobial peptide transport system permease subunit